MQKLFCASSKFRFLSFSYQFNEITNCYRLPTKLREGNVFSRVCLSVSLFVHRGGPMLPMQTCSNFFTFTPSPTPTYMEPSHSKPVLSPPPPPDLIRLVNHPSLCSSPGSSTAAPWTCSNVLTWDPSTYSSLFTLDLFKPVQTCSLAIPRTCSNMFTLESGWLAFN